MPWNECKPMDERLRFIARLLEGEKMAPLVPRVRHFQIAVSMGFMIAARRNNGLAPGQVQDVSGETRPRVPLWDPGGCRDRRTSISGHTSSQAG